MKKLLFLGAVAMAAFGLTSCSNDDIVEPVNPDATQGKIVFQLTADPGDLTRRPLESIEALQQVNDMKIYAFKKGATETDFTYDKTFNVDWNEGLDKKLYTIDENELLKDASYKFLAVGLDNDKDCYKAIDFTGKKFEEAQLELTEITANIAGEAFAGESKEVVLSNTDSAQPFSVSITLKRVVAGILLHAMNVPAFPDAAGNGTVKTVALTLSNPNSIVNLTTKEGSSFSAKKDIITWEIKGTNLSVDTKTGIYKWDATDKEAANRFTAGTYVMPVASDVQLVLELRDGENNVVKSWNVKKDGDTNWDSLLENNLYKIGTKLHADKPTTDGDNKDKPTDLSIDQDIYLIIDANWDHFHDMIIK